jgi:hypothetical protein
VVRCTPTDQMSEEERLSFANLFMHLHTDSKLHTPIKGNGSLVCGNMWGLGWRPGYNKGVDFGVYERRKSTGGKFSEAEWNSLRNKDAAMHSFYGQRFSSLASRSRLPIRDTPSIHDNDAGPSGGSARDTPVTTCRSSSPREEAWARLFQNPGFTGLLPPSQ